MAEHTVENEPEQSAISDQKGRRGDVITVVLTADNHLGYTAFGQHPRKREERQQRLRRAFQQATDFAIMQGVDLFIQAGDLFDTPTPNERDRTFVAERLAQLRQAGVRSFALGGGRDTPTEAQSSSGEVALAPQISYARLGALHYFPPIQSSEEMEPVMLTIRGMVVGICGLGVLVGQEGDPLSCLQVQSEIEQASIPILVLYAPIEGLTAGSSLLDMRAQVSRASIETQSTFRFILAGYHHGYSQLRFGKTDVIVAGATQHIDFSAPDQSPGFVFLGLAADGVRWCNHVSVDALKVQRTVINTKELWPPDIATPERTPTEIILERLRPLCDEEAMIQLRLEGELTRRQYHQLDLNKIRRYGEEQCFALAIDDSALSLLPGQEAISAEVGERFSPREELIAVADERIAAATSEQEKKALVFTKEELLLAIDEAKSSW